VFARLLLTRPTALEDVEARLAKIASSLGWKDTEVLMLAAGEVRRVPSDLPEPLSARQEEVLKVAHALGYYRTPRGCTLEQVASTLGVSANAIHKNLVGAESKIISYYLNTGL
jgi:predicted DNA binding protein